MIISKTIPIKSCSRNYNKLKSIKHDILIGEEIIIDIKELSMGSHQKINVKCDNCNIEKEVSYYDYNKITNNQTTPYYCQKCKNISIKNTVREKYGVDNVFQLDSVKEKTIQTNLEKYGETHHLKNKQILKKQQDTNLERYGYSFLMQNEDLIKKSEQTNLKKYGKKYSFLNQDVKDKIKNTNIKLYGVENPMQNFNIIIKSQESKKQKIFDKYKDYNIFKIDKDNYTILCDKGHEFTISSSLFRNRIIQKTTICNICNPIDSSFSGLEFQLIEFIKENYKSEIIINSRNIIHPLELDIYLPELKLAFEFNGVYWHCELYKDKNYHFNKTEKCEEKEIQLIYIWEDDWSYKKEIIKSIILNKLGKTENKIYARKCEIKELEFKDCKQFLDNNHIQGYINSSINIGLFYNQELVSLMTFGKKRKSMNSSSQEGEYEMYRFCNQLNTNVIGAASRLFTYFIKNYSFTEIITYADRSYSNGNLYKTLGFKFIEKTEPNYYYVIEGIRKYRYNFRKNILVKEGFDSNKTEHEIMMERGINRIYNSGNLKFRFKN